MTAPSILPASVVAMLDTAARDALAHAIGRDAAAHYDRERALSPAEMCRARGWGIGTRLVGDEGYGPSVIEITAVGERRILAKTVSSPHGPAGEGTWTLDCRDWQVVEPICLRCCIAVADPDDPMGYCVECADKDARP